jgi:hypothetical protein
MCAFVEGFGYISESLLTCRIPDVESDLVAILLDPFDLEIDANGA